MNVERVYKSFDSTGREVLFAQLSDGSEGVIRYDKNGARIVNNVVIADSEIQSAYDEYDTSPAL